MLPLGPCHLANPITSTAFRFPNSVTAIPTVRSGLQRRVITELFKDPGFPQEFFLTVLVKGMPLDAPRVGEQVLNDIAT